MEKEAVLKNNMAYNEAVTGKGYRLSDIQPFLETRFMGRSLKVVETTASTNDDAKEAGFEGAKEGYVIAALNQTNSRGSKGRSWSSKDGEGLYFSFITRPHIDFAMIPAITLITGLSVCKAIRKVTGAEVFIKWPNDIVINGKKLCGILSESYFTEEPFVVTGVGINCDTEKFEDELIDIATSIKLETGENVDKAYLLAEVLNNFEKNYTAFIENGFEAVYDEYKALSAVLGKKVRIITAEGSFEAEAVDIKKSGELVVKVNGEEKCVYAGEVSLRF